MTQDQSKSQATPASIRALDLSAGFKRSRPAGQNFGSSKSRRIDQSSVPTDMASVAGESSVSGTPSSTASNSAIRTGNRGRFGGSAQHLAKDHFTDHPFEGQGEDDQLYEISEVQPIAGDGNCGYRSIAHVIKNHERYHNSIRQGMAQCLREGVEGNKSWATGRNTFTEVLGDGGRVRSVSPTQFADEVVSLPGFGHQFQKEEGFLVSRKYPCNLVIMSRVLDRETGRWRYEVERFPHRMMGQLNDTPLTEDQWQELAAQGRHAEIQFDRSLDPNYPTIVLKWTGNESGGHYEVVRELTMGDRTFMTEKLRSERGTPVQPVLPPTPTPTPSPQPPSDAPSAEPSAVVDEPPSPSPPPRTPYYRRGVELPPESYLFEWSGTTAKDNSHAFTDLRDVIPHTKQRCHNGNEQERAFAFIEFGDQEKWPEVRRLQSDYLAKNAAEPWAVEGNYSIIRCINMDGINRREVRRNATVLEYAVAMGLDGHCGELNEIHIFNRRLGINTVVIQRAFDEDEQMEQWFTRFGFCEPYELNSLEPEKIDKKRPTAVLLMEGHHVDVVTSFHEKKAGSMRKLRKDARLRTALPGGKKPVSDEPQPPRRRTRVTDRIEAEAARRAAEEKLQADIEALRPPPLTAPQTSHCHCRNDHMGAGCARRSVNHKVEYFHVGTFDTACPHGCGALHLPSEVEKMGKETEDGWRTRRQSKCCADGKLLPLLPKFETLQNPPEIIKRLFDHYSKSKDSKQAIKYAIKLNNRFAFGSIQGTRKNAPPHGPQPIIMNGDIGNELSDLYPSVDASGKSKPSLFGQYYRLIPSEAVAERMTRNEDDKLKLSRASMEALEKMFRECHPLAGLYFTAAEKHQHWIATHGGELPKFQIVLLNNREARDAGTLDPSVHLHRTEMPTQAANDSVALIWLNDQNAVNPIEEERGIRLTGRLGGTTSVHPMNPNLVAIMFPLLNPYGVTDFEFKIPYDAEAMAKKGKKGKQKLAATLENAHYRGDDPDEHVDVIDAFEVEEVNREEPDETPAEKEEKTRKFISVRQYTRFMMQYRPPK